MIALLMGVALAQVPGQDDFIPPSLDAEGLRPVRDGRWTLGTETGRVPQGAYAGIMASHQRDPVVWRDQFGERSAVLSSATGAHLFGGYGQGRVAVGLVAPVWLDARGDYWDGGVSVLGDPSVDVTLGLLTDGPVRVAATGRAGGSLGADARMLGAGGWFGELGGAVDGELGLLRLAGDVRLRFAPEQSAHEFVRDDALLANGAVGVAITDAVRVSVEGLTRPALSGGVPPTELLVGAHLAPESGWGLHAAVGRGLTNSVGSPSLHGIVALRYRAPSTK